MFLLNAKTEKWLFSLGKQTLDLAAGWVRQIYLLAVKDTRKILSLALSLILEVHIYPTSWILSSLIVSTYSDRSSSVCMTLLFWFPNQLFLITIIKLDSHFNPVGSLLLVMWLDMSGSLICNSDSQTGKPLGLVTLISHSLL